MSKDWICKDIYWLALYKFFFFFPATSIDMLRNVFILGFQNEAEIWKLSMVTNAQVY